MAFSSSPLPKGRGPGRGVHSDVHRNLAVIRRAFDLRNAQDLAGLRAEARSTCALIACRQNLHICGPPPSTINSPTINSISLSPGERAGVRAEFSPPLDFTRSARLRLPSPASEYSPRSPFLNGRRTPTAWSNLLELGIIERLGWLRYGKNFYSKISLEEFLLRAQESTVTDPARLQQLLKDLPDSAGRIAPRHQTSHIEA